MKKKQEVDFKDYSFYFLASIILILIILAYFIIRPFLITIITSIVLAFVLYPVYKFILKFVKYKNLAALIISLCVVIILVVPLFFALRNIPQEAYTSYIVLKQRLFSGTLLGLECESKNTSICKLSTYLSELMTQPQMRYYLDTAGKKMSSFILGSVSKFVFSLPIIILNFFIMIFTLFYLLRDGEIFVSWFKKILPLHKLHQEHIFEKFSNVTYGVIYGQLLVAVIQGFLGGLGFWIFGVSSPIFWGMIMTFLALIPYLGTPIIWLPAALFKIMEGTSNNNETLVLKGVLLILYGLIFISGIDNLIKPKIIGEKAKIHPIIVLLGVLGGLKIFGIIGIIIGPVILAIMITFFKIYEQEKARK